MDDYSEELVLLMHQFLAESDGKKYKETIHKLEKESGLLFDIKYFMECVINGDWEEVEKYLSGFTKLEDNTQSYEMFFAIRKQKYYEALDKHNDEKAVDILLRDLKVFSNPNENHYRELALLLRFDNFRQHEKLSNYGDEKLARNLLVLELKGLIEANPLLCDKLQFPTFQKSRLQTLINQSLYWQLQWCKNKGPNHGMLTLFVDHSCEQATGDSAPSPTADSLMGSIPEVSGSPPLSAHGPFQLGAAYITTSLAGRTVNTSSDPHQDSSGGPMALSPPNSAVSILKHRGSPTKNPTLVYQTGDSQHILKKSRSVWISDEASMIPTNAASSPNAADMNAPVTAILTPFIEEQFASALKDYPYEILQSGSVPNMPDVKPNISDLLQSKICKLKEIKEPSELRTMRLPDSLPAVKIGRLVYTNPGCSILSLRFDGIQKLWNWKRDKYNLTMKTTSAVPQQPWHPSTGISTTNDIRKTDLEEVVPCLALSTNECYVVSASGGKISLSHLKNFTPIRTFMSPPPTATCLAFYPPNNNLIAIGMGDSVIRIYDPLTDQVVCECKGHQKRVTGIVFSNSLNIMVSSGADAQICVWSIDDLQQLANKFLEIPSGRAPNPIAQTRLQLHRNQTDVLVVHETLIAVYEGPQLDCISQWVPRESSSAITDATYSCDGQLIYASFVDGSICVFSSAALKLRCQINPTAYIHSHPSSRLHPLVIAAHPSEPNQFAVGLNDGRVHVLEPRESEGNWGTSHPDNNDPG